jgi:polyhydroxyalkanoate synthesis repressor PhaR
MREAVWKHVGRPGQVSPTHNYFAMNKNTGGTPKWVEIRKYPNRRYYDATRSRHLTLEEIHALIRDGCNVRVVDSQTSADITGKVLTQIILELDAPKLEIFPAALLTEMIRVNDKFVKGFFEKFLGQAFDSYMEYQKQLGTQMFPGSIWPTFLSPASAWTRATNPPSPNAPAGDQTDSAGETDLGRSVERLQQRLQDLERQLAAKTRQPRRRKSSG